MPTKNQNPEPTRAPLTVKQQRDARRAEKVAALKKQQAAEKRNRLIGIVLGSVAVAAVLALIITLVVTGGQRSNPSAGDVEGVQRFQGLSNNHVTTPVEYEQLPPAGGDHAAAWLNCGIYTEEVPNENAVHALEHGAVWITYDPEVITGDELATLQDEVPDTYSVLSPYPGLPSPVVISAWGAQLQLTGVDDPRMQRFIDEFWQSDDAPEPGAACTGALDGPGKIA